MDLTEGEDLRPRADGAMPVPMLEIGAGDARLTIRVGGWMMPEPIGDDADNLIVLTASLAGPEPEGRQVDGVVHARALPDIVRWFAASAAGDWTPGVWRLGTDGFSMERGIRGGRTVISVGLGDTPSGEPSATLSVDADAMTRAAGIVDAWKDRFPPRWTPEGMALPAVSELEQKQSRFLWRTTRAELLGDEEGFEARLHFDDQFLIMWTIFAWPSMAAFLWLVLRPAGSASWPLAIMALALSGSMWVKEMVSLFAALVGKTRVTLSHAVFSVEHRFGPFVRSRRFDLVRVYRVVVAPAWPRGGPRFLAARANILLVDGAGVHHVLKRIDIRDALAVQSAITSLVPSVSPVASALRPDERVHEAREARARAEREDHRVRWALVGLVGALALAFAGTSVLLWGEDPVLGLVSSCLTLGFVGLIFFVRPKRNRR